MLDLKGTVSREFFLTDTVGWGYRLGPTDALEPFFKLLYSPFNLPQYFKEGVLRSKTDNTLFSYPDSQKASGSDLVGFRLRISLFPGWI